MRAVIAFVEIAVVGATALAVLPNGSEGDAPFAEVGRRISTIH